LRNTLIGKNKKYSDIKYTTLLKLSSIYQIGVLSLVLFWVSYGSGFSINLLESIVTFLSSYIAVIVVEAVVDVGLLYFIKNSNFKTLSADFRLS
jgi:hypothetical protein